MFSANTKQENLTFKRLRRHKKKKKNWADFWLLVFWHHRPSPIYEKQTKGVKAVIWICSIHLLKVFSIVQLPDFPLRCGRHAAELIHPAVASLHQLLCCGRPKMFWMQCQLTVWSWFKNLPQKERKSVSWSNSDSVNCFSAHLPPFLLFLLPFFLSIHTRSKFWYLYLWEEFDALNWLKRLKKTFLGRAAQWGKRHEGLDSCFSTLLSPSSLSSH